MTRTKTKLPKRINGFSFRIEFTANEKLSFDDDDNLENYLRHIHGKIFAYEFSNDKENVIGHIYAQYIDADAIYSSGNTVLDVCDSISQDLCNFAETFYTDNSLNTDIVDEDIFYAHNSIYIDYLLLSHSFRGYGLADLALKKLENIFGNKVGMIALKAVPLQLIPTNKEKPKDNDKYKIEFQKKAFFKNMRYDLMEKNEKKAISKLTMAWKRMGFKKYKDEFMIKKII